MLATASSPPSTPNTSRLASTASSSSIRRVKHGSPASDSEDDYSDDEPALSVLRDDLRSTTEKFFERVTPPRGGQRRRASSVAAKAVVAATEAHSSRKHQKLRQQQSWNGLNALEKGVGQELMRRGSGTSSVSFHSRQSGGSGPLTFSKPGNVGEKGQGGAVTPSGAECGVRRKQSVLEQQVGGGEGGVAVEWKDDVVAVRNGDGSLDERPGGLPLTDAKKQRWSHVPAADDTCCHSRTASLTGWEYGGETPSRNSAEGERSRKQSRAHVLEDLRARSEEATRTLEALRVLLVEEVRSKGTEQSGRVREQQAGKLSPTRRKIVDEHDGDVAGIDRTPLLLQAMQNLQQINAELNKALRKQSSGSRRNGHHKSTSASALLQQQQNSSRGELRPRHKSGQLLGESLLVRQPRSSSDLLQRRRFEKGQSEPMSCGVPRYRTQVTRRGSEKVYFELAITQARSTWTVERHVSEFLDLRRSLVSTATDLAAAAQRQRVGSSSGSSSRLAQQTSQGAQKSKGEKGGRGSTASDCDYRRAGESRVPEITIDTGSWFERSRWGFFFSTRKREEKLAEKQVLLASWLAKVLADRELMSPDLVRFLGGDGNVLAQPIVTENVRLGRDAVYADSVGFLGRNNEHVDEFFKSSESEEYDSEEEDESESDFEDDLGSPPGGLNRSLVVPDEWALSALATNGGDPGSARGRLEAAMRKRTDVAERRSGRPPVTLVGSPHAPKFPEAQMMSQGKTQRSEGGTSGAVMKRWGVRDGGRRRSSPMVVDHVITPKGGRRRASDDPALRRPRAPSPSSPSRSVTLDAFFQAPT